ARTRTDHRLDTHSTSPKDTCGVHAKRTAGCRPNSSIPMLRRGSGGAFQSLAVDGEFQTQRGLQLVEQVRQAPHVGALQQVVDVDVARRERPPRRGAAEMTVELS